VTGPGAPGARSASAAPATGDSPPAAAALPEPILTVRDLRKSFGGTRAVDVDELAFRRGTITGLIGPNGAGKTSLVNLVTGFERSDSGRWWLDGQELTGRRPHEIARAGLVRTAQLARPVEGLTVLDNVRLAAGGQVGESLGAALLPFRWRRQERANTERAEQVVAEMGLHHMVGKLAGELSGGQRKLLEMARALMALPRVILLDEPTSGVSPMMIGVLTERVRGLLERGVSVILVEHNMDFVRELCADVVCLAGGRVVAQGSPRELAEDPVVAAAFLGGDRAAAPPARPSAPVAVTAVTEGGEPPAARDPGSAATDRRAEADPAARPDEPAPADQVLRVEDLRAGYGAGPDIVRSVRLAVGRNEVVGLIGPNGAGKSTLVKAVFGLLPVRAGRVLLGEREITDTPPYRVVRHGVGYVPQLANVFPRLTVEENLRMGVYLAPRRWKAAYEAACEFVPFLADRRADRAGLLSGGQRQLLAMSRVLMLEPTLLLLDEPSAGLSPGAQDELFPTIARIAAERAAVVLVEQNAVRCLATAHRTYVLEEGRIAHAGRSADLLDDPRVTESYIGALGRSRAGRA
jgi:branched-chain amino acid transport system ATP-binding protein